MKENQCFGYNSQLKETLTNNTINKFNEDIFRTNLLLDVNDENAQIININGIKIINASDVKIQFYNSFVFIFSLGRIFDKNDNEFLTNILDCFEPRYDKASLYNKYKVLNYNDELTKCIEQKLKIENGNYHILLTMINIHPLTPDNTQITDPLFMKSGIVNRCIKWDDVINTVSLYIARYGLIRNLDRAHTQYNYEIGAIPQLETINDKFNIDGLMNDEVSEIIDNNLASKDTQHIRVRNRPFGRWYSTSDNGIKPGRKSLNERIHECSIYDDAQKDSHLGVEMKQNYRFMPNNYVEYQLYDDDTSYDSKNGKNIPQFADKTMQWRSHTHNSLM